MAKGHLKITQVGKSFGFEVTLDGELIPYVRHYEIKHHYGELPKVKIVTLTDPHKVKSDGTMKEIRCRKSVGSVEMDSEAEVEVVSAA